jgi:outer membrane lipoprotein carrier protein
MKKPFLVLILSFIASSLFAQYDPEALTILDAMSKKYQSIPSFEANIACNLTNEIEKVNEEFKGKMTVKGEKYRLTLPEQEVVNNGTTIWTYIPDAKEVTIDNYDPGSEDLNPTKFYDIYKKGYKYKYEGEKAEGGVQCDVIDLIPEKKDPQYFKVRMNISKKDKSVQSFVLFDKQGNRYKYTITKFNPTVKVEDSFFVFDVKKYPGIEVVELR